MTQIANIKNLFTQLRVQDTNKAVPILRKIVHEWHDSYEAGMVEVLKHSDILSIIANVMVDNINEWQLRFPDWIAQLISRIHEYRNETDVFAIEQIKRLVDVFQKYVLNGCLSIMYSFFLLAPFLQVKQLLLDYNELYTRLKKDINEPFVIRFFSNCASRSFDPWKLKILQDREFVLALLELGNSDSWNLLLNIAYHPDAKLWMPNEVIVKASKSPDVTCISIYALLCGDNDLKTYNLEPTYIEVQTSLLSTLLETGTAIRDKVKQGLLTLLLPITNLSTVDSCKDKIGERAVLILLSVVTDKLIDVPYITDNLISSKRAASAALWNLAYLPSNRNRIKYEHGIERLRTAKGQTDDPILLRNIEGVLYMFSDSAAPALSPQQVYSASNVGTTGHVMISYNWANQPIVKQIARTLKDHGYNVWLDVEQMGGSTLEAMANAVEQSAVILMCMSQKYKDSPNCRLEGEYCVNRKVFYVPLMMQKGYTPDGWLGIALGAKLWYDFSSETDWDSKIAGLVKAIGMRGKSSNSNLNSNLSSNSTSTTNSNGARKIAEWSAEDILYWMQSEHIEQYYDTFIAHDYSGESLSELKYLLTHPNQPYFATFQAICKEMGIDRSGTILRLAAAIRKL